MADKNLTSDETTLCKKCGTRQPDAHFRIAKRGGRRSPCWSCIRAINKNWRDAHSEQMKRTRLKWQANNKDKHNKHCRDSYARNKESQLAAQRLWRSRNVQKYKARRAVGYAIETGRLSKLPCARCGIVQPVQAHHPDYNEPLGVVWLCPLHHAEMHPQK